MLMATIYKGATLFLLCIALAKTFLSLALLYENVGSELSPKLGGE